MDYNKKGDEELELVEGDQLRVFKRYNHWSYVSDLLSDGYHTFTKSTPGCERARW